MSCEHIGTVWGARSVVGGVWGMGIVGVERNRRKGVLYRECNGNRAPTRDFRMCTARKRTPHQHHTQGVFKTTEKVRRRRSWCGFVFHEGASPGRVTQRMQPLPSVPRVPLAVGARGTSTQRRNGAVCKSTGKAQGFCSISTANLTRNLTIT